MSELSCDTLFIGRNETHDLSRYRNIFHFTVYSLYKRTLMRTAESANPLELETPNLEW